MEVIVLVSRVTSFCEHRSVPKAHWWMSLMAGIVSFTVCSLGVAQEPGVSNNSVMRELEGLRTSLQLEHQTLKREIGDVLVRLDRVEEAVARIEKSKPGWHDPQSIVSLLVGLIAAISGFLVAYRTARLNQEAQKEIARLTSELSSATQKELANLTNTLSRETLSESRLEQHVFESLDYFSGRTQRRSIGLAVIQANWDKMPHLHSTWVSVLVTQAVYLLSEQDRKDTSEHEVTNLNNILRILQRQDVSLWDDQVRELKRALEARNKGKGLVLTEDDLNPWKEFVSKMQTKLTGGNA
jgi:hypothetical protein